MAAEVKQVGRDLDRLVDMILRRVAADRLNAKMVETEARKREPEDVSGSTKEPAPLLPPEMAGCYRRRVSGLYELLHAPR